MNLFRNSNSAFLGLAAASGLLLLGKHIPPGAAQQSITANPIFTAIGPQSPQRIVNLTGTATVGGAGTIIYTVPSNRHLIVTDAGCRFHCGDPNNEPGLSVYEDTTLKLQNWGLGFDHERDVEAGGYFSAAVFASAPEAFHSPIGLVFSPGSTVRLKSNTCTSTASYFLVGYLY